MGKDPDGTVHPQAVPQILCRRPPPPLTSALGHASPPGQRRLCPDTLQAPPPNLCTLFVKLAIRHVG